MQYYWHTHQSYLFSFRIAYPMRLIICSHPIAFDPPCYLVSFVSVLPGAYLYVLALPFGRCEQCSSSNSKHILGCFRVSSRLREFRA